MIQHRIQLVQLIAQGRNVHGVRQGLEAEHHHFLGLGEGGEVGLLQVMLGDVQVVVIEPAAAVVAGPHILKIGHEGVAEVAGQVLVGGDGVAGLGAGVDIIKDGALLGGVVARLLEGFSPVGILDGDGAVRVHGLGRGDHVLLADALHQIQAVALPGAIGDAMRLVVGIAAGAAGLAGAVGEVEVVDDELVEVLAQEGGDLLEGSEHLFIVVAEGVEHALLGFLAGQVVDGGGDAASHLDAMVLEHSLAHFHLLFIGKDGAEGFQINLVQAHMLAKEGQVGLQLFAGGVLGAARHKIDHELEIAIVAHV